MSSSDEAYFTFGNPPENPPEHSPEQSPEHSPEQSPEHSPENSSGELPAEHAEPHVSGIQTASAPDTIHGYTPAEGNQNFGPPSDPAPRYYPGYVLNFDTASKTETHPSTIVFKQSPDSGPPNVETTPPSPTFLMEASLYFKKNALPLPDDAARFALWIGHEPGGTKTTIPAGSWVFFPIIGATS